MAGSKLFQKLSRTAPYPFWLITSVILAVLLSVPLLSVVFNAFSKEAENWDHIGHILLHEYFISTLWLCLGAMLGTVLLGTISAAMVVFVDFPLKKFFDWALILPLSIPAYLLAFSYTDLCGYAGWLSKAFGFQMQLMNLKGGIFIFSLALYPYIYVPLKTFFRKQSYELIESGASLGHGFFSSFFRLVLPQSRVVIIGAAFLVMMEVLNDFGVVKYFGISTFTVGIFRAWTGFGDLGSALRLAGILMVFVFGLLILEKKQRSKLRFGAGKAREENRNPSKKASFFAFTWCALVLTLAFILPIAQMISGVVATYDRVIDDSFIKAIWHSFSLAFHAALVCVVLAIIIEFALRLNAQNRIAIGSRTSVVLGYSIPGAVIALGVLGFSAGLDRWIYGITGDLDSLLSSGILLLSYALVVRYMAVAIQNLQTGYGTLGPNLLDSSRSLGAKPLRLLFGVEIPVLRNYILAAFILVFVDILKELPLTMILRPFNYDTLATKALNLASDELLREAANPSLLIVLAGLVPIFVLNRLSRRAFTQGR